MRPTVKIFFLFFLIAGCRSNTLYAPESLNEDYNSVPVSAQKRTNSETTGIEVPKKIIKTGTINITAENIEKTKKYIDTLVIEFNAFYASENLSNTDYSHSYTLTIRVPSNHFDDFIREIEAARLDITYKSIAGKDVTEEYIDIETRLQNKRNYLKRYNELVLKANTIKEILEIEEKIRGIEEEIESVQGRLNYLENQVALSTLDLTLSKEKVYKFRPGKRINFFERLKGSLSGGWFGLVDFLLFILRLWPLWLIITVSIVFWRKYRRKKTEDRQKK
jgi:hypothetical protein